MTFKKLGKQLTEVGGIVVGSIVLFGVLMTIGVWGGEQGQIFFCGIGLLLAMFVIAWSLVGIQAVFEELKSRDKVLHFLATDHSSKLYLLNGLFDLEEAGCPVFNVVRETRAKLLLEEYKQHLRWIYEERRKRFLLLNQGMLTGKDQNDARIDLQKIEALETWGVIMKSKDTSKDISDETNRLNQQALSQDPSGS